MLLNSTTSNPAKEVPPVKAPESDLGSGNTENLDGSLETQDTPASSVQNGEGKPPTDAAEETEAKPMDVEPLVEPATATATAADPATPAAATSTSLLVLPGPGGKASTSWIPPPGESSTLTYTSVEDILSQPKVRSCHSQPGPH